MPSKIGPILIKNKKYKLVISNENLCGGKVGTSMVNNKFISKQMFTCRHFLIS